MRGIQAAGRGGGGLASPANVTYGRLAEDLRRNASIAAPSAQLGRLHSGSYLRSEVHKSVSAMMWGRLAYSF